MAEIQDVLFMTLHVELCKQPDLFSPTWLSTPMCFYNRSCYHNRNLIQPFYSQEETDCIPSNNRHCLNIHVLLCCLSYMYVCTRAHILKGSPVWIHTLKLLLQEGS